MLPTANIINQTFHDVEVPCHLNAWKLVDYLVKPAWWDDDFVTMALGDDVYVILLSSWVAAHVLLQLQQVRITQCFFGRQSLVSSWI